MKDKNKNITDIDKLIIAEEKKLERHKNAAAELKHKIKQSELAIEKYTLMRNNYKYEDLTAALAKGGLSVDDVMNAFISGGVSELSRLIDDTLEAKQ